MAWGCGKKVKPGHSSGGKEKSGETVKGKEVPRGTARK